MILSTPRKAPPREGFSILEVFVAMAILAISMVALLSSQTQAIRLHDSSRNLSIATGLARQKMAELVLMLKGKSFGEIPEEKKGDFGDKEFTGYTWVMTFKEDDEYAKLGGMLDCAKSMDKVNDDYSSMICGQIQSMGLDGKAIAETLTKGVRRLTLTVTWDTGFDDGELTVWTHYFDETMQLPGVTGGGGGGGGGVSVNTLKAMQW